MRRIRQVDGSYRYEALWSDIATHAEKEGHDEDSSEQAQEASDEEEV